MLKQILLLTLGALFMVSCQSEEDTEPIVSPIPHLEFKKIQDFTSNGFSNQVDSVVTILSYTDGDADLGYTTDEDDRFNFFLRMYVKKNGNFQQVLLPELYGNDPIKYALFQAPLDQAGQNVIVDYGPFRLITQGNKAGEIIHRFYLANPIDNSQYAKGDTLKFSIYVVDRAMNKSNTVETSQFIF